MKIALYFGSFNPIHHGHLIIANHIVNTGIVDEVWLVVSPQNPFKNSAVLLNENHRLHLVQLSVEGEPKLRASNIEFKLPKPSYTVNTLSYLGEKYPSHQFSILLGSDGFQNINKWHNAPVILKSYPLLVYKRPGFEITETFGANVNLLEAPLLQISSTHIRKLIKEGKSIRYLVPDIVAEEIARQYYYKSALENPAN
jgi:nicotinate-nucleotide adenylyltransferase